MWDRVVPYAIFATFFRLSRHGLVDFEFVAIGKWDMLSGLASRVVDDGAHSFLTDLTRGDL